MNQQVELFTPWEFVVFSHGMTSKSTRTKDPKRRKAIAVPEKECDRLSNAHQSTN
ncbi:MAG: hypothetical protein ACRC62_26080 [Microcoleus sp.]